MMEASVSVDLWTTCHSFVQTNRVRENNISAVPMQFVPPSQWEDNEVKKYCFLQRNLSEDESQYSSLAPGTALFQHWLSEFSGNGNSSWDPFNDFPSWQVMKQYPDIGHDGQVMIDGETSSNFRDYYTLWYTTTISTTNEDQTESTATKGRKKRGHLTLHGVNYQPIVYYGGDLLLPYSTSADRPNEEVDVGGMFLRRHYDMGMLDSSLDLPLEILVLPPPVVGKPTVVDKKSMSNNKFSSHLKRDTSTSRKLGSNQRDKETEPQGQGGDHYIAQSGAIMQCTAGWDWIQSTPDRNTGIWDKVQVDWIWGNVKLHNVRVQVVEISANEDGYQDSKSVNDTDALPLGNGILVDVVLNLSVTATLHSELNNPIMGKFQYEIKADGTTTVASGSIEDIAISQTVSEVRLGSIQLTNAKLWWPHTHGSQPLYSASVTFESYEADDDESPMHETQTESTFGIRTISSFTHPNTKALTIRVNGHPIFLTGGNWVTTDQFLRFSSSHKRYMQELLHMKNIGFNAIRVWGGGITETEQFYDTADRLGLLVYQEFWMTGDNNGRWAGSYDWPLDHNSYLLNAKDVIIRLRNHPSLIMYGGGNELMPIPSATKLSDASPPHDIDTGLSTYIADLDGSRIYVSSSVTYIGPAFDPTRSLAPKDGPYGIMDEAKFFDRNPGLNNVLPSDTGDIESPGNSIGFQCEIGSVSHPELPTLKRLFTYDALGSFPDCRVSDERSEAVHSEWTYFKYLPFTEGDSGIDHICQYHYPPINNTTPTRMESIEDYTWSAQLAQYFQYKSLHEGYLHRMFEDHSAVFLWKSSSPAPTLRGALYDWFLDSNGGYFGAQQGINSNSPVKVILNIQDWSIDLVNTVPVDISANSVHWNAYSLDGELVGSGQNSRIEGNSVAHLQGQIQWLGTGQSLISAGFNLQQILLYRLDLAFELHNKDIFDSNIAPKTTNSYYMSDPNKTDLADRQSRYAILGVMRHVIPKVRVEASCTAQGDGAVCHLKNVGNKVAIMVKLSLLNPALNDAKDSRILPIYFSNNYITILPDEVVDVRIRAARKDILCPGKTASLPSHLGPRAMLFIEGWNVEEATVKILCSA